MKKYDKSVVHGVREAEYLRKFDEYRLVETVDSHYGKRFSFHHGKLNQIDTLIAGG